MTAQALVLATHNRGKLIEIADLLEGEAVSLISASDAGIEDVEETGLTFIENALLKARHACALTGHAALADDSGLEVDYLDGAPGIYSARFAGPQATDEANLNKLLEALRGVPYKQRSARFRCCIAVLRHAEDPAPLICAGEWEGHIAERAKGENGFGYDPVFLPSDAIGTAAQLSQEQKQTLSHRATALMKLKLRLPGFLAHTRSR